MFHGMHGHMFPASLTFSQPSGWPFNYLLLLISTDLGVAFESLPLLAAFWAQ